jgi:hypothetical protein
MLRRGAAASDLDCGRLPPTRSLGVTAPGAVMDLVGGKLAIGSMALSGLVILGVDPALPLGRLGGFRRLIAASVTLTGTGTPPLR